MGWLQVTHNVGMVLSVSVSQPQGTWLIVSFFIHEVILNLRLVFHGCDRGRDWAVEIRILSSAEKRDQACLLDK